MWHVAIHRVVEQHCTLVGTNGRTSYFRWENFFDEQLGGESRLAGSLSSFLDIEMFVPIVLEKCNKYRETLEKKEVRQKEKNRRERVVGKLCV